MTRTPARSYPTAKPYMGRAWREQYGRSLTREEIRLVQAYRGISPAQRAAVLLLASELVIEHAQAGVKAGA